MNQLHRNHSVLGGSLGANQWGVPCRFSLTRRLYPAKLMYQELADMACERITAGITRAFLGERPIKAVLDPYTPVGSTSYVNFNTSKREPTSSPNPRPPCSPPRPYGTPKFTGPEGTSVWRITSRRDV